MSLHSSIMTRILTCSPRQSTISRVSSSTHTLMCSREGYTKEDGSNNSHFMFLISAISLDIHFGIFSHHCYQLLHSSCTLTMDSQWHSPKVLLQLLCLDSSENHSDNYLRFRSSSLSSNRRWNEWRSSWDVMRSIMTSSVITLISQRLFQSTRPTSHGVVWLSRLMREKREKIRRRR